MSNRAHSDGNVRVEDRPPGLSSTTIKQETTAGTAFVTVSDLDGQPFEVFINIGKCGSEVHAEGEAMGRLISLILRLRELGTPTERLALVIGQLRGIGSGRPYTQLNGEVVSSIPDAIGKAIDDLGGSHESANLP